MAGEASASLTKSSSTGSAGAVAAAPNAGGVISGSSIPSIIPTGDRTARTVSPVVENFFAAAGSGQGTGSFCRLATLEQIEQMCRNIKPLFNFDPPVTEEEIKAASLQFVRKISGFTKPSKANEASFLAAVDEIAAVSARLLGSLETKGPPRNREEEAAKARERGARRFGS